jgi:mannose-6-phosphate isomerase-like protein (cupin superfamily)
VANAIQTTVLLRSEQTGGMTSVVENVLPPDFGGPPLHMHDFDEAFYVLEGELTFQLEDERLTARPGQLVFAPRCVPHTLANHSAREARYLLICAPPASSGTSTTSPPIKPGAHPHPRRPSRFRRRSRSGHRSTQSNLPDRPPAPEPDGPTRRTNGGKPCTKT